MLEKIITYAQYVIPHGLLSRCIGMLANCSISWIKTPLIRCFIKHYHVNLKEAIIQNPSDYASFNAFFTRELRPHARTIATQPNVLLCPADGTISQCGKIIENTLIQAKGKDYTLSALLGGDMHTDSFSNGLFTTIYLSPKNYHRVHMPISGRLLETIYIPGRLFSVNPRTTATIPNLFARNERLVCIFETDMGKMALVLVGAMIVASIHTAWAGKSTPNKYCSIQRIDYSNQNIILGRGDYCGHFELGSTVILLFEPNRIDLPETLQSNLPVQFGQALAHIKS